MDAKNLAWTQDEWSGIMSKIVLKNHFIKRYGVLIDRDLNPLELSKDHNYGVLNLGISMGKAKSTDPTKIFRA